DELKDVQRSILVLTPSGSTTTVVSNAASATVYGGEVEAAWRPIQPLMINASVGYTHAEYDKFIDFTGDRSNEKFPVPAWQATLNARYVVPVAVGDLAFQGDYYWQDDLNLSPPSKRSADVTQKAYGLVNGRVSLEFKS